jgi:hypothetical protein
MGQVNTYKKRLKEELWDDFERGIITEEILDDIFPLIDSKRTSIEFIRGMYATYQIMVMRINSLQLLVDEGELIDG